IPMRFIQVIQGLSFRRSLSGLTLWNRKGSSGSPVRPVRRSPCRATQLQTCHSNKQRSPDNAMSLLDALLLDPYRMNVWIALRTDGVAGTGTQNYPFDGSTATKFDALMGGFSANTRVNLGP